MGDKLVANETDVKVYSSSTNLLSNSKSFSWFTFTRYKLSKSNLRLTVSILLVD